MDFSQILRFPPGSSAGIVVLSAQGLMTTGILDTLIEYLISMLDDKPLVGQLWIVESGRVRIHASDAD